MIDTYPYVSITAQPQVCIQCWLYTLCQVFHCLDTYLCIFLCTCVYPNLNIPRPRYVSKCTPPGGRYQSHWTHTQAQVCIQNVFYLVLGINQYVHHMVVGIYQIGHIPRPMYVSKVCRTCQQVLLCAVDIYIPLCITIPSGYIHTARY